MYILTFLLIIQLTIQVQVCGLPINYYPPNTQNHDEKDASQQFISIPLSMPTFPQLNSIPLSMPAFSQPISIPLSMSAFSQPVSIPWSTPNLMQSPEAPNQVPLNTQTQLPTMPLYTGAYFYIDYVPVLKVAIPANVIQMGNNLPLQTNIFDAGPPNANKQENDDRNDLPPEIDIKKANESSSSEESEDSFEETSKYPNSDDKVGESSVNDKTLETKTIGNDSENTYNEGSSEIGTADHSRIETNISNNTDRNVKTENKNLTDLYVDDLKNSRDETEESDKKEKNLLNLVGEATQLRLQNPDNPTENDFNHTNKESDENLKELAATQQVNNNADLESEEEEGTTQGTAVNNSETSPSSIGEQIFEGEIANATKGEDITKKSIKPLDDSETQKAGNLNDNKMGVNNEDEPANNPNDNSDDNEEELQQSKEANWSNESKIERKDEFNEKEVNIYDKMIADETDESPLNLENGKIENKVSDKREVGRKQVYDENYNTTKESNNPENANTIKGDREKGGKDKQQKKSDEVERNDESISPLGKNGIDTSDIEIASETALAPNNSDTLRTTTETGVIPQESSNYEDFLASNEKQAMIEHADEPINSADLKFKSEAIESDVRSEDSSISGETNVEEVGDGLRSPEKSSFAVDDASEDGAIVKTEGKEEKSAENANENASETEVTRAIPQDKADSEDYDPVNENQTRTDHADDPLMLTDSQEKSDRIESDVLPEAFTTSDEAKIGEDGDKVASAEEDGGMIQTMSNEEPTISPSNLEKSSRDNVDGNTTEIPVTGARIAVTGAIPQDKANSEDYGPVNENQTTTDHADDPLMLTDSQEKSDRIESDVLPEAFTTSDEANIGEDGDKVASAEEDGGMIQTMSNEEPTISPSNLEKSSRDNVDGNTTEIPVTEARIAVTGANPQDEVNSEDYDPVNKKQTTADHTDDPLILDDSPNKSDRTESDLLPEAFITSDESNTEVEGDSLRSYENSSLVAMDASKDVDTKPEGNEEPTAEENTSEFPVREESLGVDFENANEKGISDNEMKMEPLGDDRSDDIPSNSPKSDTSAPSGSSENTAVTVDTYNEGIPDENLNIKDSGKTMTPFDEDGIDETTVLPNLQDMTGPNPQEISLGITNEEIAPSDIESITEKDTSDYEAILKTGSQSTNKEPMVSQDSQLMNNNRSIEISSEVPEYQKEVEDQDNIPNNTNILVPQLETLNSEDTKLIEGGQNEFTSLSDDKEQSSTSPNSPEMNSARLTEISSEVPVNDESPQAEDDVTEITPKVKSHAENEKPISDESIISNNSGDITVVNTYVPIQKPLNVDSKPAEDQEGIPHEITKVEPQGTVENENVIESTEEKREVTVSPNSEDTNEMNTTEFTSEIPLSSDEFQTNVNLGMEGKTSLEDSKVILDSDQAGQNEPSNSMNSSESSVEQVEGQTSLVSTNLEAPHSAADGQEIFPNEDRVIEGNPDQSDADVATVGSEEVSESTGEKNGEGTLGSNDKVKENEETISQNYQDKFTDVTEVPKSAEGEETQTATTDSRPTPLNNDNIKQVNSSDNEKIAVYGDMEAPITVNDTPNPEEQGYTTEDNANTEETDSSDLEKTTVFDETDKNDEPVNLSDVDLNLESKVATTNDETSMVSGDGALNDEPTVLENTTENNSEVEEFLRDTSHEGSISSGEDNLEMEDALNDEKTLVTVENAENRKGELGEAKAKNSNPLDDNNGAKNTSESPVKVEESLTKVDGTENIQHESPAIKEKAKDDESHVSTKAAAEDPELSAKDEMDEAEDHDQILSELEEGKRNSSFISSGSTEDAQAGVLNGTATVSHNESEISRKSSEEIGYTDTEESQNENPVTVYSDEYEIRKNGAPDSETIMKPESEKGNDEFIASISNNTDKIGLSTEDGIDNQTPAYDETKTVSGTVWDHEASTPMAHMDEIDSTSTNEFKAAVENEKSERDEKEESLTLDDDKTISQNKNEYDNPEMSMNPLDIPLQESASVIVPDDPNAVSDNEKNNPRKKNAPLSEDEADDESTISTNLQVPSETSATTNNAGVLAKTSTENDYVHPSEFEKQVESPMLSLIPRKPPSTIKPETIPEDETENYESISSPNSEESSESLPRSEVPDEAEDIKTALSINDKDADNEPKISDGPENGDSIVPEIGSEVPLKTMEPQKAVDIEANSSSDSKTLNVLPINKDIIGSETGSDVSEDSDNSENKSSSEINIENREQTTTPTLQENDETIGSKAGSEPSTGGPAVEIKPNLSSDMNTREGEPIISPNMQEDNEKIGSETASEVLSNTEDRRNVDELKTNSDNNTENGEPIILPKLLENSQTRHTAPASLEEVQSEAGDQEQALRENADISDDVSFHDENTMKTPESTNNDEGVLDSTEKGPTVEVPSYETEQNIPVDTIGTDKVTKAKATQGVPDDSPQSLVEDEDDEYQIEAEQIQDSSKIEVPGQNNPAPILTTAHPEFTEMDDEDDDFDFEDIDNILSRLFPK